MSNNERLLGRRRRRGSGRCSRGRLLRRRRASSRLFCSRLLIGDGDDCNDVLREARIPLVELVDGVEGKASLKMNTAEDAQYKKSVKALQDEIGYDIVKERMVYIATSLMGGRKTLPSKVTGVFS